MEINFKDKDTEEFITNNSRVKKIKGHAVAKKLSNCLIAITRAPNLLWLVANRVNGTHPLTGDRNEQFAMSLDKKTRLIFEAGHVTIPRNSDNGINLKHVTVIKIIEIENYH